MNHPNIKLIPSDPMTNTILIIYCVSATGASVPYKSVWRKINPKKGKVQEIKTHNGSSYRCSPLDVECFIEVTVFFQFQNMQMQKTVQSNVVKVSRQLKQRKAFMKEPVFCRISIDQLPIEVKLIAQETSIHIIPINSAYFQQNYSIHFMDIIPEAQPNQLNFRLYFKAKFQQFFNYFSLLLGWKPQIKSQFFIFSFQADINRDTILLSIAESFQKYLDFQPTTPPPFSKTNIVQTPIIAKEEKLQNYQIPDELEKSNHIKNRSQTSLSPANKEKIKVNEKMQMKKSQTNLTKQKKNQSSNNGPMYSHKIIPKEKERQYLNVFEDDDQQQFLNLANDYSIKNSQNTANKVVNQTSKDQPSINLRGSFEQLERSFSNVNQETVERLFGNIEPTNKKMQQEIDLLKKQNDHLKRQVETINTMSKENNSLKKKYHELKQEINRLEMERKVILTDKLRCEVNWHKEIQQKEFIKKELDHLKQMFKGGPMLSPIFNQQRIAKSNSIHEIINTDRRPDRSDNRNKSPNTSFYNK